MSIKDNLTKIGYWGKDHAPQIMTGVSIAAGVGALVLAFVKADDVKQKIKDHKARLAELHENLEMMENSDEPLTPVERRQLVTAEYFKTGWELTKTLGPIVGLEIVAIGAKIFSQTISDSRYNNAVAVAATLASAFGVYRERVAQKLGAEEERRLYLGQNEEVIEVTEINEKGEEETKEKVVTSYDVVEPYAIVFESQYEEDEKGNVYKNPRKGSYKFDQFQTNNLRYDFLKGVLNQCKATLITRGRLYLAEVYDLIGYEGYLHDEEKLDMARSVGWVYNPKDQKGDPFVSFGIEDREAPHVLDFIMEKDDYILLTFNCMGAINGEVTKQYTDTNSFFRYR